MPSPKVDCSYIKMEPKMPRLQLNSVEFDNMLKICFGRKNKMLQSNLKTPQMKVFVTRSISCNTFESLMDEIAASSGYKVQRPVKMTVEDFLKLFIEFKKRGISFE